MKKLPSSGRSELNLLLARGKLTLWKWRTNSQELRSTIPEELLETSGLNLNISSTSHGKALGLHWNTQEDQFFVAIPGVANCSTATKRTISSVVARIFDVMGWFTPATLPAKLLLQEAWSLQVDWDELLPEAIQKQWSFWLQELPAINLLKFLVYHFTVIVMPPARPMGELFI